jgi:pSer/pThr/pTyr-binding forkhead associated (FHA) protein
MYSLTIEDSDGNVADHFSFDHGSYVIGRQDDCDIVLPSSSVSRRHAKLYIDDGRCYIEDLNSANGVTVDGQKVVKERHLGTASQVRVGDYYLFLEYQERGQMADQDVRSTLFISDDNEQHHKLVRINDEFAGEEFALSEVDNSIGRTDDNFILLSDQSISRTHATIDRRSDEYILRDLGSSNGTRVNESEVTGPTPLEDGDLIEFGNVEFVFAPGDQKINPREYSSSDSRRYLIGAGMMMLVLAGLVLGGLITLGIYTLQSSSTKQATATPSQSKKPTNLEERIAPILEEGRRYLENGRWKEAAGTFEHVLKIAPDHKTASKLRKQANRQKKAAGTLDAALSLSEDGKWREARQTISDIPEDTEAYQRSRSVLEDIEQNLAHKLRLDARKLMDSDQPEELKRAHDKLVEALGLVPDSSSLEERVETVESRLDEHGVSYTPYAESGNK